MHKPTQPLPGCTALLFRNYQHGHHSCFQNLYRVPDKAVVDKVSSAFLLRGITTHYTENKQEALNFLKELIPPGVEVMTGGSTTLEQIGFKDYLKSGEHLRRNRKEEILREKDKKIQKELRKKKRVVGLLYCERAMRNGKRADLKLIRHRKPDAFHCLCQ